MELDPVDRIAVTALGAVAAGAVGGAVGWWIDNRTGIDLPWETLLVTVTLAFAAWGYLRSR